MISLSVLPFIRLTTSASVGCVDSFQIFNDFRELGPCCLRFSLIVEQAKVILLRRKRSPSRVDKEPYSDSGHTAKSVRLSSGIRYVLCMSLVGVRYESLV